MSKYILILIFVCFVGVSSANEKWQQIRKDFETTPLNLRPNPLWFWNDTKVEKEELIRQMRQSKDAGYGGLSILPFGKSFKPEYLSEAYFDVYHACIEEAKRLGMTLWIYDEYGFPSGTAGDINGDGLGRFKQKYPEHTNKRLDKTEFIPEPKKTFTKTLAGDLLMAAVAMDTVSLKRVDLSLFISGDLMKCFKYLEVPGIDKIGGNRPAENFYKIVSSAAYNWDHSLVMSETYGAMGNISWTEIFNIAMDQYSKGINLLIPHATWYNTEKVVFLPELSLRNPLYADSLRIFNDFLTRLNAIMQNDACWEGDVAVLYPIQTMQSGHYMDGPLGHYKGGVEIPGLDYVDVGVNLFDHLGYDYQFLHPEVLDEQCIVQENFIFLNNKTQYNHFSTLVIPGCRTISLSNLTKIKAFADAGGMVIFTTVLPEKATKKSDNEDVKNVINQMIRFLPLFRSGLREKKESGIFIKYGKVKMSGIWRIRMKNLKV